MMYVGNEGTFTYTFEHQKRPDCPVCGGESIDYECKPEWLVEDLIESLKERNDIQLKRPSLSTDGEQIYLQAPPQLEQSTRVNLTKNLKENYSNKQILITDSNLPFKLILNLKF